jgi:hypothetical protein
MTMCVPETTDWSCFGTSDEVASLDAALKARAESLAWNTLNALLGFRLSLCPVLIRPCLARCSITTWDEAPVTGGLYSPYISGGKWYNGCGCRTQDCSCTRLCEVILPREVGGIESVSLDGVTLDSTAYRVDNANRLVRTDGDCWPICQDMTASADDVGSFVVSYYPGLAPNELTEYAAGLLAAEYYKACIGAECRLPNGVTSIARNGISITVEGGSFPGGMTGIAGVDSVIRTYNPFAIKAPPRVFSPDRTQGRVQTWGN